MYIWPSSVQGMCSTNVLPGFIWTYYNGLLSVDLPVIPVSTPAALSVVTVLVFLGGPDSLHPQQEPSSNYF